MKVLTFPSLAFSDEIFLVLLLVENDETHTKKANLEMKEAQLPSHLDYVYLLVLMVFFLW